MGGESAPIPKTFHTRNVTVCNISHASPFPCNHPSSNTPRQKDIPPFVVFLVEKQNTLIFIF